MGIGLGVKCSKEVATAIRGAIILAKLSVIPVRRGYWGNKIGTPHTVPCKVTGKCGSVLVRLVPAPPRYRPRLRPRPQEAPLHGWFRGLLHLRHRANCDTGQLRQGDIRSYFGYLRLPYTGYVEPNGVHQLAVSRVH